MKRLAILVALGLAACSSGGHSTFTAHVQSSGWQARGDQRGPIALEVRVDNTGAERAAPTCRVSPGGTVQTLDALDAGDGVLVTIQTEEPASTDAEWSVRCD